MEYTKLEPVNKNHLSPDELKYYEALERMAVMISKIYDCPPIDIDARFRDEMARRESIA